MAPGVVQVRVGRPPIFSKGVGGSPDAMDLGTSGGGCANIFTGGDDISPVTPAKVTGRVDVEKYAEGVKY